MFGCGIAPYPFNIPSAGILAVSLDIERGQARSFPVCVLTISPLVTYDSKSVVICPIGYTKVCQGIVYFWFWYLVGRSKYCTRVDCTPAASVSFFTV